MAFLLTEKSILCALWKSLVCTFSNENCKAVKYQLIVFCGVGNLHRISHIPCRPISFPRISKKVLLSISWQLFSLIWIILTFFGPYPSCPFQPVSCNKWWLKTYSERSLVTISSQFGCPKGGIPSYHQERADRHSMCIFNIITLLN